ELGVAHDLHGHRMAGLTRGEDDGAAGGHVVGVGHRGGVVGGAVVDGDRLAAGVGQADGEVIAGGAAVALVVADIVDGDGRLRVVVDDGAHPLAFSDGRVPRRTLFPYTTLFRSELGVAHDLHGHRVAGLTRGEDD